MGETETGGGELVGYVLFVIARGKWGARRCAKAGETRKEEWATLDKAMAGLVVLR